jgi:hypothetical protein
MGELKFEIRNEKFEKGEFRLPPVGTGGFENGAKGA